MACLHQLFKSDLNVFPQGWGNCNKCVPDEKNKECPGFVEIKLIVIDVKNGEGRVVKTFPPC
jgi:hypothetical protein